MLSLAEAEFAAAFSEALAVVRGSINLDELAVLLEQRRFEEAFEIVGRAASRLNIIWSEQFVRAGTQTGDWLARNVGGIVIGFDQTNTRAVDAMRNNGLRLVSNFTQQQRRATNQALVQGITEGANPRDQARAFRNSIGLTQQQERWVRSYEQSLRSLDRDALRRKLRDGRFDSTVSRAINSGDPLSEQQIQRMVKRYRERALKLRSETIARTEALRSVHEGTNEMYKQAIENGELRADQLVRIWNTAGDTRVRDFGNGSKTSHQTMDEQERQMDEAFVSGAGNRALIPGSFGIAMEDIDCRCVVSTRILNLDEIPGFVGVTAINLP